jgi:hypothetical protein
MRKLEGDEFPSITIMVPNARLFYFFLVDFETELNEEAPNVLLTESEEIVSLNITKMPSFYEIQHF